VESKGESNFTLGVRAMESNDYTAAADYLEKAVKEKPNDWEPLVKLGDTYVKLNRPENAKEAYTKVTQIVAKQSENENAKVSLPLLLAGGQAHLYLQDYYKAFYCFREAVKKKSSDYDANWGAGYCKFQLEVYQEAKLFFEVCHELQPENLDVMFYLARSTQKAERGVTKKVVEWYEKNAVAGPKEASLYLGDIYRHSDYANRAMEQYEHYLSKGGTLDKHTAEWLEQQKAKIAEQGKKENAATVAKMADNTVVETAPVKTAPVKETLKVCPKCGRLGDKNAEICEFDGETLSELK
jgi:tetratricopeptide (TPR) repeat protein